MKVAIIGAGPSGLMCAIEASKNKNEVFLLEKNEKAGKKIYITGKGRCNVTNNCDKQEFMKNVVHNNKFLFTAINSFSCQDTIAFFENRNVKLVTERGNRVFPESYKASDITSCLVKECIKNNVHIYYHAEVKEIKFENNKFYIKYNYITLEVDKLVIATGGLSYPLTGSTGDGYRFANAFGHNIVSLTPALVGIRVKDKVTYEASGLTLKNVGLTAYNDNFKKTFEGEMNFQNGTIDGPIVLSMSSLINRMKHIRLYLDLKIGLTKEQLDERLVRDFQKNPSFTVNDEMKTLLPLKMIPDFLQRVNISKNCPVAKLRKEERLKIVDYLKRYDLEFISLCDYSHAIITSGGIDTKDINPKTFESKIFKNLYFIGEVLDVDAFTGGFNMQIALSTGYTCGKNMIE